MIKADVFIWKQDKEKNGKSWHDRAFSNIYINEISIDTKFLFDKNEVLGIVRVKAQDVLDLFKGNLKEIKGEKITQVANTVKNAVGEITVGYDDFLNHLKEMEKPNSKSKLNYLS